MSLRIAHIVCAYPPYHGGMGAVTFQTVQALADRRHEVEVFTPAYYESKELRSKKAPEVKEHAPQLDVQIEQVHRMAPSLQYGNAARIPDVQHELDHFDIVHLHYPFFGTANLIRKWKQRHPEKPLVMTYHMDNRAPGWKGMLFQLYSKYWMPKILSSADALIASSFDYLKASDAAALYTQDPQKWHELPFGVDTHRFMPGEKSKELFAVEQLTHDYPTLLFVGGMDAAHHFKGIPVLLKALAYLRKQGKDVPQVIFVGDGELRKQFYLQAKGMQLSRFVRFVGRIEDAVLPYYYNMADLFVLPSIHRGEAFGMVLLEALASGVPVLASDLPGVRTIARQSVGVVPPKDYQALAKKIEDYFAQSVEDRSLLRIKSRQIAMNQYSWEPIVIQLEKIYESLV